MPEPILVFVNGEPRTIEANMPLKTLVESIVSGVNLGACAGYAVAHNMEVVPMSRLSEHQVAAGDRIEVIRAVGGG